MTKLLWSCILSRPINFFIVLSVIVLLAPALIIPFWINKVEMLENQVKVISNVTHQVLLSEIEDTAKRLLPISEASVSLANLLRPSLEKTQITFSDIETKMAPLLFQALSTIPYLSEISYIGVDGLFFSYYTRKGLLFAIYSKASFPTMSSAKLDYIWHNQTANRITGVLNDQKVNRVKPMLKGNEAWFQLSLNHTNGSYASMKNGWDSTQDLILNTAGVSAKGAISLGSPVQVIVDAFLGTSSTEKNLFLTTKDGIVLNKGIPNIQMIVLGNNSVSFKLLKTNIHQAKIIGKVSCEPYDGTSRGTALNMQGKTYIIFCSSLNILGLETVYALALPCSRLLNDIHDNFKLVFIFLIAMIGAVAIYTFCFVLLIVRATIKDMYLRSALMKQMEATQQAERKSMSKSLAFATASHEVRASLSGINGLIEICRDAVSPGSGLLTNLTQMEGCTKDLLCILNSVLDTSKIEAGKMQLEEEEFNLENLLEEVTDLYHPVGMKKGVDVILDPFDGFIAKNCLVKGDRGKLRQVLCNLLSNAVKFTYEGHVTVKAWTKKTSIQPSIIDSGRKNSFLCISHPFLKNNKAFNDSEATETDSNFLEFVFEVNDTGKGIPKEKRISVFENYIQVKETVKGQEGTGLGLGIVQSLVRLMGGEIEIVDKEVGQNGTCFRFNTFLSATNSDTGIDSKDDIEAHSGYMSSDSHQHSRASDRLYSTIREGSHVILFVLSEERCVISSKFMERLGIKVSAVSQHKQLSQTLKIIKQKLNHSPHNSSKFGRGVTSRNDCLSIPASWNSSVRLKEVPLSAFDGLNNMSALQRKTSIKGNLNFILIVIDINGGPFGELSRAVAEFRKDLQNICSTVVWIDKPGGRSMNIQGLDEDKLPPSDMIISKPFHGSRLRQVIGLLPEFGGIIPNRKPRSNGEGIKRMQEIEPEYNSSMSQTKMIRSKSTHSLKEPIPKHQEERQEKAGQSIKNPLNGKKILVAEDSAAQRKIAMFTITKLGATADLCNNGEEAMQLICEGLSGKKEGSSNKMPYDYILMDCEMPVMDGFEATRCIREEETYLGIHIPIIALTAHTGGEEIKRMIQAGVDYHLSKPLNTEKLLEAIMHLDDRAK